MVYREEKKGSHVLLSNSQAVAELVRNVLKPRTNLFSHLPVKQIIVRQVYFTDSRIAK